MTWNAPTSIMITAANRVHPTQPEASVDMDRSTPAGTHPGGLSHACLLTLA